MSKIIDIGKDWLKDSVLGMVDEVVSVTPRECNEQYRYLPKSVTPIPGYIRYDVNPFMIEPLQCFDIDSPVREVNFKKGVQITYTTLLESGLFYYIKHVGTLPMMFMSADKELALSRVDNNIIPMLEQSDLGHLVSSSDVGNHRKTGKTSKQLQFVGGAYLVPFGARNSDKMRTYSICIMLKDEIDAWPDRVGKDGDPDALSDARCDAYWENRKIFRGSTPTIKGASKIETAYRRGDQRKYMILCKSCGYEQFLRWNTYDKSTGIEGGFKWEMDGRSLILESVRYCCQNCGHAHYEKDKERLFSPDHGAYWKPTAKPVEPNIRSYHLPSLYSPIGFAPWYKSVSTYLDGYDPVAKKVIDIEKYQVFYNNVLAEPFTILGDKVSFQAVSSHRRTEYSYGTIPNELAEKYSGSKVLFLTCQVDVHKHNLRVAIFGWCRDSRCYLIDYWKLETTGENDETLSTNSTVWGRLRKIIEEKKYTAKDGTEYPVYLTTIDARYSNASVVSFCSDYESGVIPTLGTQRPPKNAKIKEFSEFTTTAGTIGFHIIVDHYKDRLAPVLRREWNRDSGEQDRYHFNAPVNATDDDLKELTAEIRRKEIDKNGNVSYVWHRPGNKPNELWDLLVYGHAAVEILAWNLCIQHFELKTIDWPRFWDYIEANK